MEVDGINRLNERERTYLRLVLRAMSSKRIAIEVGSTERRVTKVISGAMAKLGVSDRGEAARILVETEGDRSLPGKSLPLPVTPGPVISVPFANVEGQPERDIGLTVREEQAAFATTLPPVAEALRPRSETGGDRNDLTSWQTVARIVSILLKILFALVIAIVASKEIIHLGRSVLAGV